MLIQKNIILFLLILILTYSCQKVKKYDQEPEIAPLQHGLKTSSAIGYCASLAYSAFAKGKMPPNVKFEALNYSNYSSSGILYIDINEQTPLPFIHNVGQIVIAGIWDGNDGVINIAFMDVNVIDNKYKFYGLYTIPVIKEDNGNLMTLFAEQDIIVGTNDTNFLNISMTKTMFYQEITRTNSDIPSDLEVMAQQNVWFVNIDHKKTPKNIYDDDYTANGGGQIAAVYSSTGGVLYHGLINVDFNYSRCPLNPLNGEGFIQNFEAGSYIDLGNITLNFTNTCDGKARVAFAMGKYSGSNGSNVNLAL